MGVGDYERSSPVNKTGYVTLSRGESELTDRYPVPDGVPLPATLYNPAVPASLLRTPSAPEPAVGYQQKPSQPMARTNLIGTGPERYYLPIENRASPPWHRQNHQQGVDDGAAYAPRPLPGSIADLDKILEKCDFSTNKVSSRTGH